MEKRVRLMVGPTEMPDRVQLAMAYPAINHRSEEYMAIAKEVQAGIQDVFGTKNDIMILTTSGTGAMDSAVQNFLKAGDKVVMPTSGQFGDLFYAVASGYDLDITRLEYDFGETVDVDEVLKSVDADTKAVLIVHNESSTGVVNDIEKLGRALKDTDTLFIVDSVSGAGGIELKMDEWGIDVLFTASQKALMGPPGMSFIAVSDKAWKVADEVDNRKHFYNLRQDREFSHLYQTPHTPATHTLRAIREALQMIQEEGLNNVLARHKENAQIMRDGLKEIGFELLVEDETYASPTLTAIKTEGHSQDIVNRLLQDYLIEVNPGLNKVAETTFRAGTMGYVSKSDVHTFLGAMKDLRKKGYK